MFKSDLADIGNISPGERIKIQWEIMGDPEEVIHWSPDCGCTADIRKEGKALVAEFTEQEANLLTPDQRANWYPSGRMPITKGIWVYLKDDLDLWILDANGNKVLNPDKSKQKLTFIGYAMLN